MKTSKWVVAALLVATTITFLSFTLKRESKKIHTTYRFIPKGCVFRNVMGEESSDSSFVFKTNAKVISSIDLGLGWIIKAQNPNGGWGAGSHHRQDVMDRLAVQADPAMTL